MNEIFFNGKKVKDILVREEHEESESLASGWFETGLVDRIEVEVRDQTVSFRHYLEGELYSERFVHLSKMSSVKVLHFTKRTTLQEVT